MRALTPDGHNVLDDGADGATGWIVTGAVPAVGTKVGEQTPITLQLKAAN